MKEKREKESDEYSIIKHFPLYVYLECDSGLSADMTNCEQYICESTQQTEKCTPGLRFDDVSSTCKVASEATCAR